MHYKYTNLQKRFVHWYIRSPRRSLWRSTGTKFVIRSRQGQLLAELLISIMAGSLFVVAATLAVLALLRHNFDSRSAATIALNNSDMINFLEQISTRDWQAVASLTKSSSSPYYIIPHASSSFFVQGAESVYADNVSYGLAGHWKFDEAATTTAYDSSGNMHTGVQSGNPTKVTTTSTCMFSNCLQFNGSNSSIRINGNGTGLDGFAALSITGWINPTAVSGAQTIAEKSYMSGYELLLSGSQLRANVRIGGTYYADIAAGGTVPAGTWSFISLVYDGSYVRLYLNGTPVATSSPVSGTVAANASDLYFAARSGSGTPFAGTLDDMRIYSRALSAAEVKKLYGGKVNQRYFWVADVYRNASGGLTLSPTGNTLDPAVQKVQAITQTSEGREVIYEEYVIRNLARTYSQNDWTAGPNIPGPVTSTPLGFATSTNIVAGVSLELSATSSSGSLESSTYDTQDANGAALQSIFWRGNLSSGAVVKFQLAGSNSVSGPWLYAGPDGTSGTYFAPSAQNTQTVILNVNEYRYFRYKIFLTPGSTEGMRVDDVHINWTP